MSTNQNNKLLSEIEKWAIGSLKELPEVNPDVQNVYEEVIKLAKVVSYNGALHDLLSFVDSLKK